MKSIKARFNEIKKKHSEWSSYTIFANTVHKQNFCKDKLVRNFNKLVEIGDYEQKDKRTIVKFLLFLTKEPRSTKNEAKIAQKDLQNIDYEENFILTKPI